MGGYDAAPSSECFLSFFPFVFDIFCSICIRQRKHGSFIWLFGPDCKGFYCIFISLLKGEVVFIWQELNASVLEFG